MEKQKITFEELIAPAIVFSKGILNANDISNIIGNFNINLGKYFYLVDGGIPTLSRFVDYDGYVMKIKELYSLGYFINEEQTLADIFFMISKKPIIIYLKQYFQKIEEKKAKTKVKGMK